MRMHTGAQNGEKYTRYSYHIGQMPTGSAAIICGSRESVFNLNQHLWAITNPFAGRLYFNFCYATVIISGSLVLSFVLFVTNDSSFCENNWYVEKNNRCNQKNNR